MAKPAKSLKKMRPAQRTVELSPTHIKDLVPDPANRRLHNPRNIGMVVDALHRVGAGRSIVIDEDNVVLAGNGVLEAAAEAGITKVRVVEVDGSELVAVRRSGLSADDKRALAIYDNRAGELAEWNPEQLQADVEAGLDLKPWFSEEELAKVLGQPAPPKAGLTDPDAVPAVRATDIRLGDLFELGGHLLLCGDSTKAEDVQRLMGPRFAQCIFTDPPYGVAYDGGMKKRTELTNDHVGTDIYARSIPLLACAADSEAPLYLWYADGHAAAAAAAAAGYQIVAQIIWAKNHAQFVTSAHYKGKHEPCFYGHKKGKSARWHGPNNEVTLWEYDRSSSNDYHPTQKPVAVAERAITNSTESEQIVLDGFGGGGTTLVACEALTRTARMMEIESSYCQVIIDRWEAFTGLQATKVGEAVAV